jgi:hypothetical protein
VISIEDNMPYVNKPRPYAKEYQQEKERGEHERRMERQRGRRAIDKRDTGTVTKKSPKRNGKDVAHVVALDKGGSNKDGLRIESAAKNRSFKRDSKGNLVSETSKKERKK